MLKLLRKLFGKPEWVFPLYDAYEYAPNPQSYSGGSLENVTVIVVMSDNISISDVDGLIRQLKIEQAQIKLLNYNETDLNDLLSTALDRGGPFIRLVNVDATCDAAIPELYFLNQLEIEALVSREIDSSICNILIENSMTSQSLFIAFKSLIQGLAPKLLTHRIIINGLYFADDNCNECLAKCTPFLLGKYGYALAGEILHFRSSSQ